MFKTTWRNPRQQGRFGYRLLVLLSLVLFIFEHTVHANQSKTPPNQPRHVPVTLQERDDAYDIAKEKGEGLSCEMEKPTSLASTWTDYNALATWGWIPTNLGNLFGDDIDDVFVTLNVDKNQNVVIDVTHSKKTTVEATGAFFNNVYNVPGGCIVADNTRSPANAKPGLSSYPLLQKWSDITFLQWQKTAGGNTQNLNHVIRSLIVNEATKAIIRQALGESTTFEDWNKYTPFETKGKSFFPGSNEYHALLGSPNGSGVGYLLLQHKAQLGVRSVSRITVFGEGSGPGMYFKIDPFTPPS